MLRNYLAAALRNLVRSRLYAAITIVGLAVGFATALLIALFVRDEFSYDHFFPDYKHVYVLADSISIPGRATIYIDRSPPELMPPLKAEFPGFEAIARLNRGGETVSVAEIEDDEPVFWADPGIFDILKFPTVAGDLAHALDSPDGLVLTRTMARKYFGIDNPIGRSIEFDHQHAMRVMAVIEDLPSNSTFSVNFIAAGTAAFSPLRRIDDNPPQTFNTTAEILMKLPSDTAVSDLQNMLPDFLKRQKGGVEVRNAGVKYALIVRPLASLHLAPGSGMKPRGNLETIYAITVIGLLIIAIASINFVNLMTARAQRRAVEVGVRKATGAGRAHLIVQFIGESLIYAILGMTLGLILARAALSTLNAALDRTIHFGFAQDITTGGFIVLMVLFVGVLAGAYPAFVLTSFRPASVLKAASTQTYGSGFVRQALVTLQFAVLIVLLVATGVVYRQVQFGLNESKRVASDQILGVYAPCKSSFREAMRTLPGVVGTACGSIEALGLSGNGAGTVILPDGTNVQVARYSTGFDFFELYGLQPVAGRFFSEDRPGDAMGEDRQVLTHAPIVINETAAHRFGFASAADAVGKTVTIHMPNIRPLWDPPEIIGVVGDYSIDAVHSVIQPAIFYVDPTQLDFLSVKVEGARAPEVMKAVDDLWKKTGGGRSINRFFLNQYVRDLYADITRQGQLFAVFAGVAIFIAILGLFGMSVFVSERRTKEIGVRKAMGANRSDILRLLLWEFAKPVLLANAIAWPAGYLIMRWWLNGFAYHIDLRPWMFFTASVLALLIAMLTVLGHVLLVARAQPASALRYE